MRPQSSRCVPRLSHQLCWSCARERSQMQRKRLEALPLRGEGSVTVLYSCRQTFYLLDRQKAEMEFDYE
jgi:hypothetical protein